MAGVCTPLEATVKAQLAADFRTVDGEVSGRFDMDDVLRGNFEQQTTAFAQAIGTGQMTPQEARRARRLPDIDGADQLLVNAALVPLKIIEQVSVGTGADVNLVPQRIKSLTPGQRRTVQGRTARAASLDDIDPAALVADLGDAAESVLGLLNAAKVRGADIRTFRQWINASIDDIEEPKELTA
jgi:hypothetical protein